MRRPSGDFSSVHLLNQKVIYGRISINEAVISKFSAVRARPFGSQLESECILYSHTTLTGLGVSRRM